ncbi:ATP-binding protein [Rossellomorea vietnamensis]|uniref:ATP-binding protein n=1 Tax=Rossellomorea vietnamensis TaxID=218284 RepID=UPI001FD0D361|nr:ATP-binding protein [Rossellomorea vietnamensis]
MNEPAAASEDIEYNPDRKLNKQLILDLATGYYIERHHNIILMGASGKNIANVGCSSTSSVLQCYIFVSLKY